MPYLLRRLIGAVILLLAVSIAIFALLHAAKGDPASIIAGQDATQEQVDLVRKQLGLDQPLPVQYFQWLGGAVHGDFGTSYILGRPVAELMLQRIGSTIQLVASAVLLMVIVSLAAGVALTSRRKGLRNAVDYITTVMLAVPPFVSSIVLIFALSVLVQAFPPGGEADFLSSPLDSIHYLILPALALSLPNSAILARLLATDMRRAQQEEFVLTARSKGASPRRIVWRHEIPYSLSAYVTQIGIAFGALIGGAVVVEAIFARAGIGGLLIDAVNHRDYPTAQAVLLLTVSVAIVVQFVTEVIVSFLDPRVRLGVAR